MGIAFLRMDRSRAKWRIKLQAAFHQTDINASSSPFSFLHRKKKSAVIEEHTVGLEQHDKNEGRGGKWALFLLPFITVLREGLEAVIFVAGVSLSFSSSSFPLFSA